MRTTLFCTLICLAAPPVFAQVEEVTTAPPNLVLPNYNTVPVGPFGGLEGTAFAARVGDPSASWFNPAGLARESTAQISGSAGVYQWTSVSPKALANQGGSIQQLPNFVGFTFTPTSRLTAGAALVTTNAWNQETDSELIGSVPGGQQRFAYSADSEFEERVLALAVGYHGNGGWRFGGGLAFSLMDLRLSQSASDRIADGTGLNSLLVTSNATASAFQLRSQFGAQYDVARWRFGAAVRTPGITLHRSGEVTLDAVLDAGPSSLGSSVFDPKASAEYHLPWEFQGGAAWVGDRVELELDAQAYSSIDAYPLVSTSSPVLIYGDAGTNQPPSVIARQFPGMISASDSIVNVSAGGHVRLFATRDMQLHAGIGNNRSPVGGADTVFNTVDLLTWTLGLSGSLGNFRFSAGFNNQTGTSDNITLRNLLNGRVVQTPMDVNMGGFIYSLAYQF